MIIENIVKEPDNIELYLILDKNRGITCQTVSPIHAKILAQLDQSEYMNREIMARIMSYFNEHSDLELYQYNLNHCLYKILDKVEHDYNDIYNVKVNIYIKKRIF